MPTTSSSTSISATTSTTIACSDPAFDTAVTDLRAGADHLAATRERIGREVDGLLDGGWSGTAATAFADAWQDWWASAGEVHAGLVAMGDLVAAVHRDLAEQDAATAARLDVVAGRIVERLG